MSEALDARVRVERPRCPYCHDEVPRGEEPVACPGCLAMHHEACLREHGACASCGATHPRFAPPPPLALPSETARRAARALAVSVALGGLLGLVSGGNDAIIGLPFVIGGLLALVDAPHRVSASPHHRSASSALAALAFGVAVGLAIVPSIDEHVWSRHREACFAWAGGLLLVAMTLGIIVGERVAQGWKAPTAAPRPGPPEKGPP